MCHSPSIGGSDGDISDRLYPDSTRTRWKIGKRDLFFVNDGDRAAPGAGELCPLYGFSSAATEGLFPRLSLEVDDLVDFARDLRDGRPHGVRHRSVRRGQDLGGTANLAGEKCTAPDQHDRKIIGPSAHTIDRHVEQAIDLLEGGATK
jgi:hypothetical protein